MGGKVVTARVMRAWSEGAGAGAVVVMFMGREFVRRGMVGERAGVGISGAAGDVFLGRPRGFLSWSDGSVAGFSSPLAAEMLAFRDRLVFFDGLACLGMSALIMLG